MTPVAMPVIIVLMQFYPGAGTAIPAPKEGVANIMATFLTEEICQKERASRRVPEDFFCLEYRSEKIMPYTFPQDKSRQGSLDNISVGPIALKDADKPYIEPLVEPPKEAVKEVKKVAQHRPAPQQAMFNGNVFAGLFNW